MGCTGSKEASADVVVTADIGVDKCLDCDLDKQEKLGDDSARSGVALVGEKMHNLLEDKLRFIKKVVAHPLDFNGYHLPVHEKSNEEKDIIQKGLGSNFVFDDLTERERKRLILAFEKKIVHKDESIIKEGDKGNYFYVVAKGKCKFEIDGKQVGEATAGTSFGELALLYNCPRAASVTALEEMELFRIDQLSFRYVLQSEAEEGEKEKKKLLCRIDFLKGVSDGDIQKLVQVMTPYQFRKDDYIVKKGDTNDDFFILHTGTVKIIDIHVGGTKYEDKILQPGDCFGEQSILRDKPRYASVIALADGEAFKIDKQTFQEVLGDYSDLVERSMDKTRLQGLALLKDADEYAYSLMAKSFVKKSFESNERIMVANEKTHAALYIVRSGKVQVIRSNDSCNTKESKEEEIIGTDGIFGTELLMLDTKTGNGCPAAPTEEISPYTVEVLPTEENCICALLTIEVLRTIIDTTYIGKHGSIYESVNNTNVDEFKECMDELSIKDFHKHKILGEGSFGQVWLVSYTSTRTKKDKHKKKSAFALKIQSKYQLVQEGAANDVINEKSVMLKLRHPFLCKLVASFQDPSFLFMLLHFNQGGELSSIIHRNDTQDNIFLELLEVNSSIALSNNEDEVRFYSACLIDALTYMHRRGYAYRDLKPDNIMITNKGYPCFVDFGFTKYITHKTFTFCGTPLYIAPEIINNRGYNRSADHWSMGCLIYEMLTTKTPFYRPRMSEIDLFRAINKGEYTVPDGLSHETTSLLNGLLTRNPAQRLGCLKGGEHDIIDHPFFSSIDFAKLRRRQIVPPYTPTIKDPFDSSMFSGPHNKDKMKVKFPDLSPEQQKLFDEF